MPQNEDAARVLTDAAEEPAPGQVAIDATSASPAGTQGASREAAAGEVVETAEPEALQPIALFHYLPYAAMIFVPLTYLKSLETAALVWYWINVALVFLTVGLSIYALSGTFSPGRRGMFIVPLLVTAPFIYFFLPTEAMTLLALFFVVAGLAAFRKNLDAVAGFLASLAVFSPLGWAFGLYYLLKRSWSAVLGWLIGVVLLLAVVPIIVLGPQRAWETVGEYRVKVASPMIERASDPETLLASENQSVWALLVRRSTQIGYFGTRAAAYGEVYKVKVARITENWTLVVFVVVGFALVAASVVGVTRKLRDRNGPIVGLEGAAVVLATLLLSPFTTVATMVALILPVLAVVQVIMSTDIRRLVHHVNYIGLILATAFFYLSFDPVFMLGGSAFAGAFILWVAVLAGINRFRPQMVHGRATATFTAKERPEKAIDLAPLPRRAAREEKRMREEDRRVRPMPDFIPLERGPEGETPRKGSFIDKPRAVGDEAASNEPSGLAKFLSRFTGRKDEGAVELNPDADKGEVDKGLDASDANKRDKGDDKKITLD